MLQILLGENFACWKISLPLEGISWECNGKVVKLLLHSQLGRTVNNILGMYWESCEAITPLPTGPHC